jgi:Basic region leucine zipper
VFGCRGKAVAEQRSLTIGAHVSEQPAGGAYSGQQAHPGLRGAAGSTAVTGKEGSRPDDSSGNSSETRNGDRRGRGSNGSSQPLHTDSSGSGAVPSSHGPLPPFNIALRTDPLSAPPSGALLQPPVVPMDMTCVGAGPANIAGSQAVLGATAVVKVEGGPAFGVLGSGAVSPGRRGGMAADAAVPRRVIANRQSAARSKERRRGYVIGLEQSVKNLTLQINEQQGHLHSLASNSATLCESSMFHSPLATLCHVFVPTSHFRVCAQEFASSLYLWQFRAQPLLLVAYGQDFVDDCCC